MDFALVSELTRDNGRQHPDNKKSLRSYALLQQGEKDDDDDDVDDEDQ